MRTEHLYQRETFRYSSGWSHLDDWQFLCTVRLTPMQQVREGNGYDLGGVYLSYARVPRGKDWRQIARALEQTLEGSRCRHEYDCCGCASRRVTVRLIAPRRLQVRMSVSYNR